MIQLEANRVGGGDLFWLLHIKSHFFNVYFFFFCMGGSFRNYILKKPDKGLATKGQLIFHDVMMLWCYRAGLTPVTQFLRSGFRHFRQGGTRWHVHGHFVYLTRQHRGVMTDCSALLTATEWDQTQSRLLCLSLRCVRLRMISQDGRVRTSPFQFGSGACE